MRHSFDQKYRHFINLELKNQFIINNIKIGYEFIWQSLAINFVNYWENYGTELFNSQSV